MISCFLSPFLFFDLVSVSIWSIVGDGMGALAFWIGTYMILFNYGYYHPTQVYSVEISGYLRIGA